MSSQTPEALRDRLRREALLNHHSGERDADEHAAITWGELGALAALMGAAAATIDALLDAQGQPPARDDAPAAGAQEPRCKATRTRARSSRCELVHGHAGAHKHRDWLWANDEPATPTPGAGGSR